MTPQTLPEAYRLPFQMTHDGSPARAINTNEHNKNAGKHTSIAQDAMQFNATLSQLRARYIGNGPVCEIVSAPLPVLEKSSANPPLILHLQSTEPELEDCICQTGAELEAWEKTALALCGEVFDFNITVVAGDPLVRRLLDAWLGFDCPLSGVYYAAAVWSANEILYAIVLSDYLGCGGPSDFLEDAYDPKIEVYRANSLRDLAKAFVTGGKLGSMSIPLRDCIDYDALVCELERHGYVHTMICGHGIVYLDSSPEYLQGDVVTS